MIESAGLARQAQLVHAGDITPTELVEAQLERIAELDPAINAFRVVLGERALAEAKEAEQRLSTHRRKRLPLGGVPVAIADTEDVAGEVTCWGSIAYDRPAHSDSVVVRRLRAAGAIVIGKTNVSELGAFGFTESHAWGITRNPWNPDRSAGGSCGGSAAAVAAGMTAAASGIDGSGGIRVPAAYCGLFGLKPQRGRVPLAPLPEHWHGMSTAGCLTRTVADTALWLDVVAGSVAGGPAGPQPRDHAFAEYVKAKPRSLRIAYSSQPTRLGVAPPIVSSAVKTAIDSMTEALASLGHRLERRDPDWGGIGREASTRILRGIADQAMSVPHPGRLEPRIRGVARIGRRIPMVAVQRARRAEAKDARRVLGSIFSQCDVLLMPVAGTLPLRAGRWEDSGAMTTLNGMQRAQAFCPPWNHLGNPAASIPAGVGQDGMPVAVQIIGRPGDEPTLLSLAAQIEAAHPWPTPELERQ